LNGVKWGRFWAIQRFWGDICLFRVACRGRKYFFGKLLNVWFLVFRKLDSRFRGNNKNEGGNDKNDAKDKKRKIEVAKKKAEMKKIKNKNPPGLLLKRKGRVC